MSTNSQTKEKHSTSSLLEEKVLRLPITFISEFELSLFPSSFRSITQKNNKMYSNMGGGMIGFEMPLKTQNTQNHLQKHPQIMGFTQQQIDQQQTQLSMKQPNYSSYNNNPNPNPTHQRPKIQATQFTNSDEDDQHCQDEQENSSSDLKRKSSSSNENNVSVTQWQRMKWTDNMVRLLIMAVYYIGDEAGGSELGPEKRKPGGGGGGGALQKKGKWKSVSRAMIEKGFYVSPQQCEDKFNDLNKRYKRVNEILGKGTACNVVEDISLLESMEVEVKSKEEVRKLLNSKHLFFREMCAYHSSCGHAAAAAAGGGINNSSENATASVVPVKQPIVQQQQQQHLHQNQQQQNNNSTEGYEDRAEDGDEDEDEDDMEEGNGRKRARKMTVTVKELDHWGGEVMRMLQDGSKSSWEKKQWVMSQMVELEENGVKIQREGLELEKERLKWMKFSSKKERDMERMRIENEKKRLEIQRMLLLLRKNEIEFLSVDQQKHPSNLSEKG